MHAGGAFADVERLGDPAVRTPSCEERQHFTFAPSESVCGTSRKNPIVLVRTDFRDMAGNAGGYNPMLTQAATIRLDLPAASTTEVVSAVLEALERIKAA